MKHLIKNTIFSFTLFTFHLEEKCMCHNNEILLRETTWIINYSLIPIIISDNNLWLMIMSVPSDKILSILPPPPDVSSLPLFFAVSRSRRKSSSGGFEVCKHGWLKKLPPSERRLSVMSPFSRVSINLLRGRSKITTHWKLHGAPNEYF